MARRSPLRWALHCMRLCCVAVLVALLPRAQTPDSDSIEAPSLNVFTDSSANELKIAATKNAMGTWSLFNPDGETAGAVARTRPAANEAIGYRGVTEAALWIDQSGIVRQVAILASDDTPEHVQAIRDNRVFLNQFVGLRWPDEISQQVTPGQIDGVSGATLTSLAMAEGVRRAAGAKAQASTVFPKPISDVDAKMFETLDVRKIDSWTIDDPWLIPDSNAGPIRIVRTGPLADSIHGYQGPTELLIAIGADDRIQEIVIRQSYDNEPYVSYLKPEPWFWNSFRGKTIGELAAIHFQNAGVEGVSGATMTSQAVAATIMKSAAKMREQEVASARTRESKYLRSLIDRVTPADAFTLALLLIGAIWQRWGGSSRRKWRKLYLSLVIVIVGFWSGNLLSLTLISGWAHAGIAWRLAPVLALLFVTSFVLPAVNKSNPYCNHVCPHGAIQQLVMPNRKRRTVLPHWVSSVTTWVPGLLLALAYVSMILSWGWHYANWEPFHAYRITLASAASITLAVASVLASIWMPMAYCRYGCPTGRLIDYIRRRGIGDRIAVADVVVLLLVVLAVAMRTSQT
jgi:NosR/NirI family transcriptional regulator, nitrous oxide reductase regulator